MAIRVALHHRTSYRFDRLVMLSPHEIRLRPAPHCRTPVQGYSLRIEPEAHFINWQQDPYGNWVARLVFPEPALELVIEADLTADMTVINPFDFFVEPYAENYPFAYAPALGKELIPFLETAIVGPRLHAWLIAFRAALPATTATVPLLVALNQQLQREVLYLVRMEAGVQTPDETLERACGSCRDSAWLLVQILRHLGLAARFASGYLIQLTADVKALDGPSGTTKDFTDLHAWAEVFLPGAGWIGFDPTSGLLAGEGHLPLACTADPGNAAPVIGATDPCEVTFAVEMTLTRMHEDPRVTKPYTEAQWSAINALGLRIDESLNANDVRLTQGGEPTFVSVDDMEGAEWNYTASSPAKRALATDLRQRLATRFAPGGFLHEGQGKWYPGEPLPRWALGVYWRHDGVPIWRNRALNVDVRTPGTADLALAQRFIRSLAAELQVPAACIITAYEDVPKLLSNEAALPANVDPLHADLTRPDERARLARLLMAGLATPAGFILPLRAVPIEERATTAPTWQTSPWPLRRERLYLVPGDSPLGARLPLASLPEVLPEDEDVEHTLDPFAPRDALAAIPPRGKRHDQTRESGMAKVVIKTALVAQIRDQHLYVYMPPLRRLPDYLALIAAVEDAAAELQHAVAIEGYPPPHDPRIAVLNVTPDPGVIEVNVQPAASWPELMRINDILYSEARTARLATEKFMLDGRHAGTGGGNHVTLGGASAADSPLLRRPDLLRSLVTYWQNHPALSYLFSGLFVGPTSQSPRVDEARDDHLYELEIAFQQMARAQVSGAPTASPWLVDRLLRHLLTDLTGNTHRAEFSIDKLYSPDGPAGRLGLLEFRAFEMPPHQQMSAVQMLLLRALVARFWQTPHEAPLVHWGTGLHDRWMLPHFVESDMRSVVSEIKGAGYAFDEQWFAPFLEFRFPRFGTVTYDGVSVELRQAIEPWHVLGEEMSGTSTARYVDSSVERLQVKVTGANIDRHCVTCNGRTIPLVATDVPGEFVAGLRFRAWNPPSALHPTIDVQAPLVFDVVDLWASRSIGGCTYHVVHPGGRNYDTFPVNANEAEARRIARFWPHGHTPGPMTIFREPKNPSTPATLDLRWQPARP